MAMSLTPLEKTEKPIDIAAELAWLAKMTVPQLRLRHMELIDEPAKSYRNEHLARPLACRWQTELEDWLPEETRQLALAIARDAPLRIRIERTAARGVAERECNVTTRLESNLDSRPPMPDILPME